MDLDSASKGKESAETINKRQNARLDKLDKKRKEIEQRLDVLEQKIKNLLELSG